MRGGALARAWPGVAALALALTALLVVLLIDRPPPVVDSAPSALIGQGRTTYAANCAVCHGVSLGGGVGPALSVAGLHHRHPTALDLYQSIKARMPVDGVARGA